MSDEICIIFNHTLFYRQDRETCINNLKLNLKLASPCKDKSHLSSIDDQTYTRKREALLRGSLENVYPYEYEALHRHYATGAGLRRCRSLAVSKGEIVFEDTLSIKRQRRSQLIPRAKLVNRSSLKER